MVEFNLACPVSGSVSSSVTVRPDEESSFWSAFFFLSSLRAFMQASWSFTPSPLSHTTR